jgi:hypothetical protein
LAFLAKGFLFHGASLQRSAFAGNDRAGLRQQVPICSGVGVADDRLGRREGAE